MNGTLSNRRGGITPRESGPDAPRHRGKGRVVLAAVAAGVADALRREGWDVHTADTADEAARLALRKHAAAVVLPADTDDESGYLTCAKLRTSRPELAVVLVGPGRDPRGERLSRFVGGTYAVEDAIADAVTRLV